MKKLRLRMLHKINSASSDSTGLEPSASLRTRKAKAGYYFSLLHSSCQGYLSKTKP